MFIRRAKPGDGESLFEITRRSIMAFGTRHYSVEQLDHWMGDRTADNYENLILSEKVFVAEYDGKIIGFVSSIPGEVTRLFVDPTQSGKGIGGQLLKIGIEAAHSSLFESIVVNATLNAKNFYIRHGFREIAQFTSCHVVGGPEIVTAKMEL